MITPLFPENDEFIIIEQGYVGDCYLLASLDCIFSADAFGYASIKNLFIETSEGIKVKIPRTDQSAHLKLDKMKGKYGYEIANGHDVFFLSHDRLREIDESAEGVKTNALAVKILERLSTYYFSGKWPESMTKSHCGLRRCESVSAHDVDDRFERGGEVNFVSKLLGIAVQESRDIDTVIKIKSLFPHQPIYIAMKYGKLDQFGKKHELHALKMHQITSTAFYLVNPWNNLSSEAHEILDLRRRDCQFAIYKTNPQHFEWISLLLHHPTLLQFIFKIKSLEASFHLIDVEYCIKLYHYAPHCCTIFDTLTSEAQKSLVMFMAKAARMNITDNPRKLFSAFMGQCTQLRRESNKRAQAVVADCVHDVLAFSVSFDKLQRYHTLDQQQKLLLNKLHEMVHHYPHLSEAMTCLGFSGMWWYGPIAKAIEAKTKSIMETFTLEKNKQDLKALFKYKSSSMINKTQNPGIFKKFGSTETHPSSPGIKIQVELPSFFKSS